MYSFSNTTERLIMEGGNKIKIMSVFAWKILLIHLAILFSLTVSVHAQHDTVNGLAGPEFSDPDKIQEMPEDWMKKPLRYDQSVGKADLVITLDQHLYPALVPIIQKYAKKNNIKAVVNEGTCGISSGMLERKEVDIVGFCCPPDTTDRLPGLKYHTIGIDALALLVHPDNPVENLSVNQARQIFMGEIFRWSEIETSKTDKGLDLPVQPIGRLHCKLRPGHWRLLLDNEDLFSTGILEVGAISDMMSKVASNRASIGYEVLWNLVRYKDKGKVKALNINGHSPYKTESLISGGYPFYRVYNITTWEGKGLENQLAGKLVEYILQHSGDIDEKHRLAPASLLRKAGWKFKDNELIGIPE